MNKTAIVAIAMFAAMTVTANAKEWKSQIIRNDNGKLIEVTTVQSCNYAKTVSLARQEADKHENAFFNLVGSNNTVACPVKPRKPKAE
jgi:D-serine dehydratase